jgi:pimeloyl-ACP methyl ester carboxylesterase
MSGESGDGGKLRPAGEPDYGKSDLQRQPDPARANPLSPDLQEPPSAFVVQPPRPARGKSTGSATATLARGTVKSIHYTLSYVVQSAAAGPQGAIVLLHDLPGGAFSWDGVLPGLAGSGRAVYAFDLLGYGQSEHPWPSDTSNWGHADCLQYALRALGLRDITLVGIGVGGAVAQVLSTRLYRSEVARLVLINSYAYQTAHAPNWPLPDMHKRQDPDLPRQTKLDQLLGDLRTTLPQAAVKPLPAARVKMYLDEWNSELGKEMLFQHIRLMLPNYTNAVSTNVELLDIPVLLLWGERDTVTPVGLAERIARANPNARLQVVPNVGHLLLDDAPKAVASAIAGFS